MRIDKVLNEIDKFAPWQSALDWDNVGLLVGRESQEVKKAVVCLDVDDIAVDFAIKVGADLIVSHHPLFISSLKSLTNQTILRIIEQKLAVICVHTNLDMAPFGVNFELANLLGLQDISNINQDEPIGLLGKVKKQSLLEFAQNCKKKLEAPFATLYSMQDSVENVAVCGGNGSSLLPLLWGKADVLVSSDFKYHQIMESKVSILDVGHYWSERLAINILKRLLNKMSIEIFVPTEHKIDKLEVI